MIRALGVVPRAQLADVGDELMLLRAELDVMIALQERGCTHVEASRFVALLAVSEIREPMRIIVDLTPS